MDGRYDLIDTHCHLDVEPIFPQIEAVLSRAQGAGVSRVIAPAYDIDSWSRVETLSQRAGVFPAFGLHPWVADQRLDLESLAAKLETTRAVAVGEPYLAIIT